MSSTERNEQMIKLIIYLIALLEAIKTMFKLVIEFEKQAQKLVEKFDKLVKHATKLFQVIKALTDTLIKR